MEENGAWNTSRYSNSSVVLLKDSCAVDLSGTLQVSSEGSPCRLKEIPKVTLLLPNLPDKIREAPKREMGAKLKQTSLYAAHVTF